MLGLLRCQVDAAGEMLRRAGGQVLDLSGEPGREDRAEDGHAEGAADGAEEGRGRGGNTDLLWAGVVLHDEHEHLHHETDADADDEDVDRGEPGSGADCEPGEQVHADNEDRCARNREDLVAAEAADRAARGDHGDEQPRHQRQQAQPRAGGAGAVDELQVERDEDDRPEHRHPDRETHRIRNVEDTRAEQGERQESL